MPNVFFTGIFLFLSMQVNIIFITTFMAFIFVRPMYMTPIWFIATLEIIFLSFRILYCFSIYIIFMNSFVYLRVSWSYLLLIQSISERLSLWLPILLQTIERLPFNLFLISPINQKITTLFLDLFNELYNNLIQEVTKNDIIWYFKKMILIISLQEQRNYFVYLLNKLKIWLHLISRLRWT